MVWISRSGNSCVTHCRPLLVMATLLCPTSQAILILQMECSKKQKLHEISIFWCKMIKCWCIKSQKNHWWKQLDIAQESKALVSNLLPCHSIPFHLPYSAQLSSRGKNQANPLSSNLNGAQTVAHWKCPVYHSAATVHRILFIYRE